MYITKHTRQKRTMILAFFSLFFGASIASAELINEGPTFELHHFGWDDHHPTSYLREGHSTWETTRGSQIRRTSSWKFSNPDNSLFDHYDHISPLEASRRSGCIWLTNFDLDVVGKATVELYFPQVSNGVLGFRLGSNPREQTSIDLTFKAFRDRSSPAVAGKTVKIESGQERIKMEVEDASVFALKLCNVNFNLFPTFEMHLEKYAIDIRYQY